MRTFRSCALSSAFFWKIKRRGDGGRLWFSSPQLAEGSLNKESYVAAFLPEAKKPVNLTLVGGAEKRERKVKASSRCAMASPAELFFVGGIDDHLLLWLESFAGFPSLIPALFSLCIKPEQPSTAAYSKQVS